MSENSLVEMIKKVGLSEYEARCYLALLERDILTVNEIAKISGVVRSSVYDVLEKLLMKGFVAVVPGQVKKYTATAPGILKEKSLEVFKQSTALELEDLKRRQQANLAKKLKEISEREDVVKNSVDELIRKLDSVYKRGRINDNPLDYIEVIKDFEQVNKRIIQLVKNSRKEILTLTRSRIENKAHYRGKLKSVEKSMEDQAKAVIEALKRGVKVRSIYELSPDPNRNWVQIKNLEATMEADQDVRVLSDVPIQMLIFDANTIIFNLEDTLTRKRSDTSQIITHHDLAMAQKILFETLWEQAENFQSYRERMNI